MMAWNLLSDLQKIPPTDSASWASTFDPHSECIELYFLDIFLDLRNCRYIPADLKVADLVKAFKVIGYASGLAEISEFSSNIHTTGTQTTMRPG